LKRITNFKFGQTVTGRQNGGNTVAMLQSVIEVDVEKYAPIYGLILLHAVEKVAWENMRYDIDAANVAKVVGVMAAFGKGIKSAVT